MSYADTVLWCLRPEDVDAALRILNRLERSVPGLRQKVCLVQTLNPDHPAPPFVAELYRCFIRDFKTYQGNLSAHQSSVLRQGIERIVHFLRGVQIGVALGGGAARGMTHLGVIKALESHGIYADMLAGTSAGAMVGGMNAAGFDPAYDVVFQA